eukprot:Opistho-1_new@88804
MPTIHTGSSTGLRCSFASRSVPMLPGPISAHLILFVMGFSPSMEAHRAAAEAANGDAEVVAGLGREHGGERAREDHLAGLEADAERAEGVGQPRDRVDRRAERGGARAGGDDLAVLLEHHAAGREVDAARIDRAVAEHEHAARGVVGHGVGDPDLPVADARVDDLEAGHHAFGGGQHVGIADARAHQVALEDEGDLALGLGLDQRGAVDRFALADDHAVEQVAEVGLEHAEHVHHGARGHADLLADDALAGLEAARDHALLHAVGIGHGDALVAAGERIDDAARAQRLVELVAELLDQCGVHGLSLRWDGRNQSASARKSPTSRAKRAACSIWVQWPQRPNTCSWLSAIHWDSVSEPMYSALI